MNIDWILAFGVIMLAGGLAILTVLAWRGIDRWAGRRVNAEVEAATAAIEREATDWLNETPEAEAEEPFTWQLLHGDRTCAVPTFGTERCGLLAGHVDQRHLSWPSGRHYPPDPPGDDPFAGPDALPEPCQPIGCDNGIHLPGCTYAAIDADEDQVLEVDPPVVPYEHEAAGAGWVQVGDKTVHRSCNEDRRDGRHERVCAVCADRLGMAPTGGAA